MWADDPTGIHPPSWLACLQHISTSGLSNCHLQPVYQVQGRISSGRHCPRTFHRHRPPLLGGTRSSRPFTIYRGTIRQRVAKQLAGLRFATHALVVDAPWCMARQRLGPGIGLLHIQPCNDAEMAQIEDVERGRARQGHCCHQAVRDAGLSRIDPLQDRPACMADPGPSARDLWSTKHRGL